MSNDLVARLRAEAARLREQADSLEASADILGGPAPRAKRAPGPKPKRSGEQRRPPSERGPGKTAQRVAAYFATHPKTSNAEAAKALGLEESAAGYHLAKLRKAAK